MAEVTYIARCPEHGLHGCRDTCFECGRPVERVPMVPAPPPDAQPSGERGEEEISNDQLCDEMERIAKAEGLQWDRDRGLLQEKALANLRAAPSPDGGEVEAVRSALGSLAEGLYRTSLQQIAVIGAPELRKWGQEIEGLAARLPSPPNDEPAEEATPEQAHAWYDRGYKGAQHDEYLKVLPVLNEMDEAQGRIDRDEIDAPTPGQWADRLRAALSPPARPGPLVQAVRVTRVGDRHEYPHKRDFAESQEVTVEAGGLGSVVGEALGPMGLPEGSYVIAVSWPHEP